VTRSIPRSEASAGVSFACQTLALVVVLLLGSGGEAFPQGISPFVSVTSSTSGLLSVHSSGATLTDVLSHITRASGVKVLVENTLANAMREEVVTATFSGITAEEFLRRVLRGKNFVFVYAADTLVEARVYVEGTGPFQSLTENVPAPAPGMKRRDAASAPKAFGPTLPKAAPRIANSDVNEPEPARLAADALKGIDAGGRLRALEELSRVSDARLIRWTAEAILRQRDEDPEVLSTALDVLGQVARPPLDPVLDLLRSRADFGTRIRALDYLAEHGARDLRVREAISQSAQQDEREEVVINARELLKTLDAR